MVSSSSRVRPRARRRQHWVRVMERRRAAEDGAFAAGLACAGCAMAAVGDAPAGIACPQCGAWRSRLAAWPEAHSRVRSRAR
jgi:hypothetical protein